MVSEEKMKELDELYGDKLEDPMPTSAELFEMFGWDSSPMEPYVQDYLEEHYPRQFNGDFSHVKKPDDE